MKKLKSFSILMLVIAFFCVNSANASAEDQTCTVTVYYKSGALAKSVTVSTDVSGGLSCSGGRSFTTDSDGVVTLKWVKGCYLRTVFVKGKGYTVDYEDGKRYSLTLVVD